MAAGEKRSDRHNFNENSSILRAGEHLRKFGERIEQRHNFASALKF